MRRKDETSKKGLRCDHPGCKSKIVFRRKYELLRHKRKHGQAGFPCTAVNCKFRGAKAFYREDKLKAHVYEGHDDHTLFACPVPGCLGDNFPLPRYLMAIHCRNHNLSTYFNEVTKHLVALEHCDRFRKCPIGTCLEKRVVDMHGHLQNEHSQTERLAFAGEVVLEGFEAFTGHFICPTSGCNLLHET
jgi:hypothetical protein